MSSIPMTEYLGAVEVRSGYYGGRWTLHLCRDESGTVWGVYEHGYITFADPKQGIPPLPIVCGACQSY